MVVDAPPVGVFSCSERSPEGAAGDARYLRWHLMHHLPEQHRLPALRGGLRWVSTPACREARAASVPPWDRVDHVVHYLFASAAMDPFFALGAELAAAGRIPERLPAVHLGGFVLEAALTSPAAGVDAAVVPWRPHLGVHLVIHTADGRAAPLESVVEIPGVAGVWQWRAEPALHPRFDDAGPLALRVVYLEADPVDTAAAVGEWATDAVDPPLLAAPMHTVVAPEWERHLP